MGKVNKLAVLSSLGINWIDDDDDDDDDDNDKRIGNPRTGVIYQREPAILILRVVACVTFNRITLHCIALRLCCFPLYFMT